MKKVKAICNLLFGQRDGRHEHRRLVDILLIFFVYESILKVIISLKRRDQEHMWG